MKACQVEKQSHLDSATVNLEECCQNTLDILKEKPWKTLFKKLLHNWSTRSRLGALDESQLKDLGLTSADVNHEIRKPLWK